MAENTIVQIACAKCGVSVSVADDYKHKCEKCGLRLCRPCDDRLPELNWTEVEDKDFYFCRKCAKRALKKAIQQSQTPLAALEGQQSSQ